MIDLTKRVLPSAVEVEGNLYPVHTDFQYWLCFQKLIQNPNTKIIELDFLYSGKKPADRIKGAQALMHFAFPPKPLPRPMNSGSDDIVIDFDLDADLIYSAFMQQYRIDLVETPLHWYKFRALLDGLQNTKLSEVMGYRSYTKSSKTDEQSMKELKRAWAIEKTVQLSDAEKAQLEKFEKLANGNATIKTEA